MSENTQGTATGAEVDRVTAEGEVLDAPTVVDAPSVQMKADNWSRKLQGSLAHLTRDDWAEAVKSGKIAEFRDMAASVTAAASKTESSFAALKTFAGAYAVRANDALEGDALPGNKLAELMSVSAGRVSHYRIAARLHFDFGVNPGDPMWAWTSKQPVGLPELLKRKDAKPGDLAAFKRELESADKGTGNSGTATTGRGAGTSNADENESVKLPRNRTTAHLHIGQLLGAMENGLYGELTAEEWATLSQLVARGQALLIAAPAKVRTDGAAVLAKRTAKARK
jgi:hypothetical protein